VTVFFYNPNIHGEAEYNLRLDEIRRLSREWGVELIEGEYDTDKYFRRVGRLAHTGEGGERCRQCFQLRLEESLHTAERIGAEVIATTLTVSPHKKAEQVNAAGKAATEDSERVIFLEADFKKKDGFRISSELSKEFDFYRQDYCGCIYSRLERDD
jgi:predicted adenine nucleotide alpha hydrolase (AANH) superfamily ATPase